MISKSKYQPSRGGHAPGHLREAFEWAVEASYPNIQEDWYKHMEDDEVLLFFNPEKEKWWNTLSLKEKGRWLIGQLWNCTDIMPSVYCDILELNLGSTYAMAVRKLRAEMED
jgi:hypothetical protein